VAGRTALRAANRHARAIVTFESDFRDGKMFDDIAPKGDIRIARFLKGEQEILARIIVLYFALEKYVYYYRCKR
jgi:hypothetical protein